MEGYSDRSDIFKHNKTGAKFEHKVDDYLFIFHLVHIEITFLGKN